MKSSKRKFAWAIVTLMALNCCMAGAVVLGDPNGIFNGTVTINAGFASFTPKLDVTYPTALTGTSPIRVTIGHPGAKFLMQAYGSGRTDNLKNSGVISATGERLIVGGDVGTSVMMFANAQFTTGPGHLFIQGAPGATMGYVGIGTSTPTTRLDVAGEVKMTVANITGGSDLAEKFEVRGVAGAEVKPGLVVCIDPEKTGGMVLASAEYDKTVAGIISGAGGLNTGMLMGQQHTVADGAFPVALSGRVYCMVDATAEAVERGDMLTTSATPGHAMRVTDHVKAVGCVIGKAMEPLAKGKKGMILVLVTLQ